MAQNCVIYISSFDVPIDQFELRNKRELWRVKGHKSSTRFEAITEVILDIETKLLIVINQLRLIQPSSEVCFTQKDRPHHTFTFCKCDDDSKKQARTQNTKYAIYTWGDVSHVKTDRKHTMGGRRNLSKASNMIVRSTSKLI